MAMVKAGGKDAFVALVHRHQQSLLNYFMRLGAYRDSAEDLVQEAFIKLWEQSGDFDNEYAARSFLYTTVKNRCLNHLEHKKVIGKYADSTRHASSDSTETSNHIIISSTF